MSGSLQFGVRWHAINDNVDTRKTLRATTPMPFKNLFNECGSCGTPAGRSGGTGAGNCKRGERLGMAGNFYGYKKG